jgi:hypothetical protein
MENTKESLKITAFTQRIAQLVTQYETQLIDLRAEATIQIETLQEQVGNLTRQLQEAESANNAVEELTYVEPQEEE